MRLRGKGRLGERKCETGRRRDTDEDFPRLSGIEKRRPAGQGGVGALVGVVEGRLIDVSRGA